MRSILPQLAGQRSDGKKGQQEVEDIMGPFPAAIKQLKFLVVDIDYFTKWVVVKTLATITEKNVL